MEPVDEILERALQLSSKDRGKIVAILIQSLDPPGKDISKEEWEKTWSSEIQRRIEAVKSGEMELIDAEEVFKRLGTRLKENNRSKDPFCCKSG